MNFIFQEYFKKILQDNDQEKIKEYIRDKVGLFFFSCNISFVTVEKFHFQQFVKALCKINFDFKLPSRHMLSTTILDRIFCKIDVKRKELILDSDAVLLCDGWKNKSSNRKLLVFSLRNELTPQTFLTAKDMTIQKEYAENYKVNIEEAINYAKEKYNTNVYSVVTDNDAKTKKGVHLVKNVWQSTCHSHSGNCAIKGLYKNEENLKKFREIYAVFNESKYSSLICKMGGLKLKNYPDTRFCYIRDSFVSLLRNIEIIREIARLHNIPTPVNDYIADDDFIRQLMESVKELTPVCKLINFCQNPKKNVADAVHQWFKLRSEEGLENAQWLKDRIKTAVHPVAFAAYVLHHKYKEEFMDEEQKKSARSFTDHERRGQIRSC